MLAYAYLRESALMDLDDLQHNTRNGLHIASLAGTWFGLVAGLGGLRDHSGRLSFAPRLPPPLTRLSFRLGFRHRRLMVEIAANEAVYTLVSGRALADRPPRADGQGRDRRTGDAADPGAAARRGAHPAAAQIAHRCARRGRRRRRHARLTLRPPGARGPPTTGRCRRRSSPAASARARPSDRARALGSSICSGTSIVAPLRLRSTTRLQAGPVLVLVLARIPVVR